MPEIVADRLYTTREAGAVLRASTTTLRNWVRDGRLRSVRIGPRKVFFLGADLQAMIVAYKAAS